MLQVRECHVFRTLGFTATHTNTSIGSLTRELEPVTRRDPLYRLSSYKEPCRGGIGRHTHKQDCNNIIFAAVLSETCLLIYTTQ